MQINLEGRKAVVTESSEGIGYAIAKEFVRADGNQKQRSLPF
ncbi:hypothetical protein [Bacillus sp. T33-2]|nr:hypothetical protein [Bacillus sp. T33-2]